MDYVPARRPENAGDAEQTIWWHVYPLGACDAPVRGDHSPAPRLRRLIDWLVYAADLGATGLLLGPIFASTSHGYDTTDYFRIDERLGTESDFDALVAACRELGLRLLLDGVFSHAGRDNPLLDRALVEGPGSWVGRLFDIDWASEAGPRPRVFEGHCDLVRFDHEGDVAADYAADVMKHWLRRGIDGWRLDAAYSVAPAFWAKTLGWVREEFPGAYFLGEVIHGDYARIVAESTMTTTTEYELWKSIWSSILDRNFFELDWTLKRHNDLLESFVPQTFVGNHDTTRIASKVGADGAMVALALLMTVGGTPSVYYGDEQGFVGVKEDRAGGDDAVRPALPASPADLSPLGWNMFAAHKELIGLRRARPWLTRARTEAVVVENTHYIYRTTATDGSGFSLEVELGVDDEGTHAAIREAGQTIWAR